MTEYYTFFDQHFDVDLAKKIVLKRPRQSQLITVETWWNLMKDEDHGDYQVIGLFGHDAERAARLTAADCARPGILICLKEDFGNLVIDGWHRIAACHRLGIEKFPVYVLTPEEARRVFKGFPDLSEKWLP